MIVLCLLVCVITSRASSERTCKWNSKAGSNFDLQKLKLSKSAYSIEDGDIPCTSEVEPTFGYIWNFCGDVPDSVTPDPCSRMGKRGVVMQYKETSKTIYTCNILGHYDPKKNELEFRLLDVNDPSKGVSITYPKGESCGGEHPNLQRSATIDVECSNVEYLISSANEPQKCAYHISMKSYYGCPSECPITSAGLCNSHGHCAYDPKSRQPYCYCNEGWGGDSCSEAYSSGSSSSTSYDGYSVQIGLLVTLLLLALGLTGGVIYLAFEVAEFRKHQTSSYYSALSGGENEMVETVNFQ